MFYETEYQDTYQTKFLTFVAHVGELPGSPGNGSAYLI